MAQEHVDEARASLARIQEFEASNLGRREELGKSLNLLDAVPLANRIIGLFQQVSLEVLRDLPLPRLTQLKQDADSLFNVFSAMLNFSDGEENAKSKRDNFLTHLTNAYDHYFEQLTIPISYSTRRSTDFAQYEREARAAIQSIEDKTSAVSAELKRREMEADGVLAAIRKIASEQGVSQQASFFKAEADLHETAAEKWLTWTKRFAITLGLLAFASMFMHKVEILRTTTIPEAIQFGIGKGLVFATLAYAIFLTSRNYLAHKHNAVVNQHRRNSLVTYEALVAAAGDKANRDIVLSQAATTIFSAQATGFTPKDHDESKALSMVNVGANLLKPPGGSTS
jgi:hypothetical protein